MKNPDPSIVGSMAPLPQSAHAAVPPRVDDALRKYATHLTAALSLVVGVSGVMMFFHIYKWKVQAMHEWIGMAFLLALLGHLLRNRRMFVSMIGQRQISVFLSISALVAFTFVLFAPPDRTSPSKALTPAVLRAPLAKLAPVLGLTLEQAQSRVAGFTGAAVSSDATLAVLAENAHLDPIKLLNAVLAPESIAR